MGGEGMRECEAGKGKGSEREWAGDDMERGRGRRKEGRGGERRGVEGRVGNRVRRGRGGK